MPKRGYDEVTTYMLTVILWEIYLGIYIQSLVRLLVDMWQASATVGDQTNASSKGARIRECGAYWHSPSTAGTSSTSRLLLALLTNYPLRLKKHNDWD